MAFFGKKNRIFSHFTKNGKSKQRKLSPLDFSIKSVTGISSEHEERDCPFFMNYRKNAWIFLTYPCFEDLKKMFVKCDKNAFFKKAIF